MNVIRQTQTAKAVQIHSDQAANGQHYPTVWFQVAAAWEKAARLSKKDAYRKSADNVIPSLKYIKQPFTLKSVIL